MSGITRRTFLRIAGTAGTLSLIGCATAPSTSKGARARVVIVGGGYGGSTAAKYLKLFDPSLDVTLSEKRKNYISCAGSNEVISGWHEMDWLRRSREGLRTNHGINLVQAKVVDIDPEKRIVELIDGTKIPYDRLVLSPGIVMRFDAIEGYDLKASKFILIVHGTVQEAERARNILMHSRAEESTVHSSLIDQQLLLTHQ